MNERMNDGFIVRCDTQTMNASFHRVEIIDSDCGWKAACSRLVVDVMGGSRTGSGEPAPPCPSSDPVITSMILRCAKCFSQIRGLHGPLPWHLLSLCSPLGLDLRNYWKFWFNIQKKQ